MTGSESPSLVRPLSISDLEGLSHLFVSCFSTPPWNEAWSFPAAHERLSNMIQVPSCRGVVAVLDDTIVGAAFGQIEGWIHDKLFLLQEFCVSPPHQKRGIGKALLCELLPRLARAEHVSAVYLLTDHASPAQAFYERLGFAPSAKKVVMGATMASLLPND